MDDWDGEEADRDCSEEERVQDEDVVEVGEEEEDAGNDDADSDVTCMDENEHIEDEIGQPPQDDDQIDRTEDGEEELDEDGDEEVVSEGGDVVVTVEDEVEEVRSLPTLFRIGKMCLNIIKCHSNPRNYTDAGRFH